MGAKIGIRRNRAFIEGVSRLYPAGVTAPDLRGGAALVIAALQTDGTTRIGHTDYIDRGYENIERDMRLLGADIKRYR
jgi:UDP-N-acetylglucosamine 1-carboxyvinyltransferase